MLKLNLGNMRTGNDADTTLSIKVTEPKDASDSIDQSRNKPRVIKSVNTNQHAIIRDILELHNDGKPIDCDITYSIGGFYGKFKDGDDEFVIDQPKYKFDVFPQFDDVVKLDPLGPIPLEDNSLSCVFCDLPFVISCGPSMETPDYDENGNKVKNNMISRRFSSYYPVSELLISYKHWIDEVYRVLKPGGICAFKNQDSTTGGRELRTTCWSWLCASSIGFEVVDCFHLIAKARLISGKVNKQQHARKYSSIFWVFKKGDKKNIRYFDHMSEDEIGSMLDGLKEHWTNPKNRKNN
jgi:hypothetical protein